MNMKNNFVKFKTRYILGEDAIYINSSNLNFSRKAYERLGGKNNVDVFYDKDDKLIKIVPVPNGRKVNPNRSIGSKAFSRQMPKGRYTFFEKDIYKLEE